MELFQFSARNRHCCLLVELFQYGERNRHCCLLVELFQFGVHDRHCCLLVELFQFGARNGPFHGKSSHVEKNKLSNSAMKTSIYYFCIAYLICSKTNLRIQ